MEPFDPSSLSHFGLSDDENYHNNSNLRLSNDFNFLSLLYLITIFEKYKRNPGLYIFRPAQQPPEYHQRQK